MKYQVFFTKPDVTREFVCKSEQSLINIITPAIRKGRGVTIVPQSWKEEPKKVPVKVALRAVS